MNRADPGPGALILGGGFVSLEAARTLAAQGVQVRIVGHATSPARFSRSVRRSYGWPRALQPEMLPEFLSTLARDHGLQGWVVFPTADAHLRVLAEPPPELRAHFALATPRWEAARHFFDKRLTYALARQTGVPIPDTWTAPAGGELAAGNFGFPVVLKPAISAPFFSATNRKAYRADDRAEFQRCYAAMVRVIPPDEIIVQEFLPDAGSNLVSYAGYFREGQPVAGLSARRKRQLPTDFGRSSTFVEAAEIPGLRELAARLLGAVRYTGLAEVEFMWDGQHARFELLEVNPRMWAWLGLARAAGLDLPYLAYADALGQSAAAGPPRYGVKWVRFATDVRAAAQEIRAGRISVGQYLRSLRGRTAFSVFSPRDPLPFLLEPLLVVLDRIGGRLRRNRRVRQVSFASGRGAPTFGAHDLG